VALMARVKPYGSPPPERPCALCGKVSSKNIRPRADNDAVICEPCLGLARTVYVWSNAARRARWLVDTASERCTFCGRLGNEVGGMMAYAPAFICPRCLKLGWKIATSDASPPP
jgi:hypothetical protein